MPAQAANRGFEAAAAVAAKAGFCVTKLACVDGTPAGNKNSICNNNTDSNDNNNNNHNNENNSDDGDAKYVTGNTKDYALQQS